MSSLMQPHTATETQEIRESVIPESDYPPYSSEKIHVYLIIIKLCKEEKKIQKRASSEAKIVLHQPSFIVAQILVLCSVSVF